MRNRILAATAVFIAAIATILAPTTTASAATVDWACPPTQAVPAPPNPFLIYFGAASYVSGNDPSYMKNLCGQAPGAQSSSWVKYTEVDGERPGGGDTVAFLGLPGAVAIDTQFAPLTDGIGAEVDKIVIASYLGKRFDVATVINSVKAKIVALLADYDQVVVFGSSTGGPLASQVLTQLPAADQARIDLLLGCSPAGNNTLSASNQTLGTVASFARFLGDTTYMEDPFWRAILIPLKMRAEWGTNYQADQILYNANYKPLANGSLAGLNKVVYYAASQDETVNDDLAYPAWQAMRGGNVPLYTEPGSHVGFGSSTADWLRDITAELP